MKKIIDWKLYNTETAEYIGGYTRNGTSVQDFNYIEKSIYKTKNGQFFEYIVGGAATEYACHEARMRYAWRHINLMATEDIIRWLEENSVWLSLETIDKFLSFLEVQEG